ncbi:hypothetical protein F2Q68_00007714 [Brassica cretica]|uniref:Uncharacterized protein n=1 Tax=Brassica cretica TaxID=69181 RepID=A0A8S9KPN3_BRACR|nr:hypothetical protein F2Q68_00007714 [Brassica cretica]
MSRNFPTMKSSHTGVELERTSSGISTERTPSLFEIATSYFFRTLLSCATEAQLGGTGFAATNDTDLPTEEPSSPIYFSLVTLVGPAHPKL